MASAVARTDAWSSTGCGSTCSAARSMSLPTDGSAGSLGPSVTSSARGEFCARGIDFVLIWNGIDILILGGRFTFHVIAAVADFLLTVIFLTSQAGVG